VAQQGAAGAGTGDMLKANNLSDLASIPTARTNLGLAIGTNVQAWDTDLDALAANASNGMIAKTGVGTVSSRTLTADTGSKAGIAITNGNGVSGNPTIGVDISGQTTDASPDLTADYVMTFDTSAGVNKKALLNTLGSSIFTKSYTSADQTITAAGALTLAHGMGVAPEFVFMYLICQTNEAGYTAGNVVWGNPINAGAVASNGLSLKVDATNITVRIGSAANPITISHGTTGVGTGLTNANWKLRFKAWA